MSKIPDKVISRAIARALVEIIEFVCEQREMNDSNEIFKERCIDGKQASEIDLFADQIFKASVKDFINGYYHHCKITEKNKERLVFLGEESYGEKSSRNLSKEAGDVFFINDPIDGTDLFERGLGNWCSAAIAIRPSNFKERKIIAAGVASPPREFQKFVRVYHATASGALLSTIPHSNYPDQDHLFVEKPISIIKNKKDFTDASICFYGQKVANFLSFSRLSENIQKAQQKQGKKLTCRLYNLGGIPMMVEMIDSEKKGKNIDAVIEILGQKVHDAIPGLYIAKQAGATLKALDNSDITEEILEELLLLPKESRISYVLASTKELAESVVKNI